MPKTNLKLGEISFKFRATALWNGLNINIKNADNIDVFKQKLTKDLKCDIYNCDKFCLDLPKYYNELFLKNPSNSEHQLSGIVLI